MDDLIPRHDLDENVIVWRYIDENTCENGDEGHLEIEKGGGNLEYSECSEEQRRIGTEVLESMDG